MSSLLSVRARLFFKSVEAIEASISQVEFEEKETDSFIVWRKISLRSEEIWTIAQYDADRCIVTMYDATEYFVKEPYAQLHKRWQAAKVNEPIKMERTDDDYDDEDEEDD